MPHNTVRTNNGGELAGSKEFFQTIANHGYLVEPTTPDASKQSQLAERPHKTLKERAAAYSTQRALVSNSGLTHFYTPHGFTTVHTIAASKRHLSKHKQNGS
jgi:hypothetical protein